MSSNIYLDHAATTRLSEGAFAAMLPFLKEDYGNASAKYYEMGKCARRAVGKARQQVAALLGAQPPIDEDHASEIVFTSGATESNNWVLKSVLFGKEKRHIVTTSIEHHSVLETAEFLGKNGCELTVLPVDGQGLVNPDDLRKAMRADTALVSIMLANNEVGTIQPIPEMAKIAHEGGALFHTDAVQAAGKLPLNVQELGVDYLSISGHKFYGPKGVGALYVRKGLRPAPLLHGGGQESHRRAGTINVAGIVGMGQAAQEAQERMEAENLRQRGLVERLWQGLSAAIPKIYRNGHPELRLPNILNVRLDGAEGEAILLRLDMLGIQVASGSACSTDSLEPSHVLLAMGIPQEHAHGSIRFSLGMETTAGDIERVIEIMPKQVQVIREMSVTWEE